MIKKITCTYLMLLSIVSIGQNTQVGVTLNAKHTVGGIETFEREKFITIHADQGEHEWDGNFIWDTGSSFNFDLRDDFLNGYDVFMGRNSGGITWYLNNLITEDPGRSGYADPASVASNGSNVRGSYALKTNIHPYEARHNQILVAQKYPFWTGTGQQATGSGWSFANATATGEYMGRYINEFYENGNGQPKPTLVEIINEPAYSHLGGAFDFTNDVQEIADFHNDVAAAIKAQAPGTLVGGYTTAFPNFEVGNFQRWNKRWKLFMDVAGANMDFWSIHLYDWPSYNGGEKHMRSGSNVEATFDMMEQYSDMLFSTVKPFVISEYGAQMHDQAFQQWSAFRDWLHVRSSNSLLMSFLSRPDNIAMTINFLIVKAEWGYSGGIPYNHRLVRKDGEPGSYSGFWRYSDMVKFYELWSDVNGTRIDSFSDDLDIQVEAYVDGDKMYLVLNNLNFTDEDIDISLFNTSGNTITALNRKHYFLNAGTPTLDDGAIATSTSTVTLKAEGTMILEYTFGSNITVDQTNAETKYYADTYLQSIAASTADVFQINGVSKSTHGEAVLRIGLGRDHGDSLNPIVSLNGSPLTVPSNWRGDDQADRDTFFGVLEIPVPYSQLQANNTISVTFPDSGGYISTVTLQVFNFSSNLRLGVDDKLALNDIKIYPNPTNSYINISNITNINKIELYNITGSKVKEFEVQKKLNISNLSSGIYLLKLNNTHIEKVIKH